MITKPRLFFLGDSFVKWHLPLNNHWTTRFQDEYEVISIGAAGSSNEGILCQFATLPDYQKGDRLVVILTNPYRLPVWFYFDEKGKWNDLNYTTKLLKNNITSFIDYILLKKSKMLNNNFNDKEYLYMENPLQVYNLFKFLYTNLIKYKPIFVTWSKELNDLKVLEDLLYYIPEGTYTTIQDEHEDIVKDHHPGEKGGLVWYETIKKLLDNWEIKQVNKFFIGSPYFKNNKNIL